MSRGFEKGWQVGLKARGTDIVVTNRGGSLTPKPFDASVRDRIASLPRIDATCNILVEVTSVEDSDLMILSAREWGCFAWNNLELVSGRMPRDAAEETVVLGQTAAEVLKKKVGDSIQIETKQLTVVGIVKGGALVEDGSVILSLPLLQGIIGAPTRSTNRYSGRLRAPSNKSRNLLDRSNNWSRFCAVTSERTPQPQWDFGSLGHGWGTSPRHPCGCAGCDEHDADDRFRAHP